MIPAPQPLRIFIDPGQCDKWHRAEWEQLTAELTVGADELTQMAANAHDADVILVTHGLPSFARRQSSRLAEFGYRGLRPHARVFAWDQGDFPTGELPGLYCSLPRPLFDDRMHATISYPLCYNEQIDQFDCRDAERLLGFHGSITSGDLRAPLIEATISAVKPEDLLIRVQPGAWSRMFDRTGFHVKTEYAETLRRCKFVLCPRGHGMSSVRLFETMKAGRVPVIVSDDFVLPEGIDWKSFAVILPEEERRNVGTVLASHVERWPEMAARARAVWEETFDNRSLLRYMGRILARLYRTPNPTYPKRIARKARIKRFIATERLRKSTLRAVKYMRWRLR